jgi:hypothetical protein
MATAEPALHEQAKSWAERPSVLFYILLAAALLIFIQTYSLLAWGLSRLKGIFCMNDG